MAREGGSHVHNSGSLTPGKRPYTRLGNVSLIQFKSFQIRQEHISGPGLPKKKRDDEIRFPRCFRRGGLVLPTSFAKTRRATFRTSDKLPIPT